MDNIHESYRSFLCVVLPGIVGYADGLLIANSFLAGVYYLDLDTKEVSVAIPPETVITADGLAIDGDTLYVAQNGIDIVSVWELASMSGNVSTTHLGNLESEYFDAPATCRIDGDTLYAANARFVSLEFPAPGEEDPSTFNASFAVVGVDKTDLSMIPTSPTSSPAQSPVAPPVGSPVDPSTSAGSSWHRSVAIIVAVVYTLVLCWSEG